jgi:cytochrome c553
MGTLAVLWQGRTLRRTDGATEYTHRLRVRSVQSAPAARAPALRYNRRLRRARRRLRCSGEAASNNSGRRFTQKARINTNTQRPRANRMNRIRSLLLGVAAVTLSCAAVAQGRVAQGQVAQGQVAQDKGSAADAGGKSGAPNAPAEPPVSMCIGCHAIPGYQASFPQVYRVPKIGGQSQQYIEAALKAYRQGDRNHPTMVSVAKGLTDEQIAAVAAYYAQRGR